MVSISNQKVRKTSCLIWQKTTQFTPFERTILPIAPRKSQVGITSNPDTTIPRWEDLSMRMDWQVRARDFWATICSHIVEIVRSFTRIVVAE